MALSPSLPKENEREQLMEVVDPEKFLRLEANAFSQEQEVERILKLKSEVRKWRRI
jgi:hypothetical protein